MDSPDPEKGLPRSGSGAGAPETFLSSPLAVGQPFGRVGRRRALSREPKMAPLKKH